MDCTEDDAKAALIALFFLGKPHDDIPFMWTLSNQIHKAYLVLLGSQKFRNLENHFGDRKSPLASRAFYALTANEDATMTELKESLAREVTELNLVAHVFDACVVRVRPSDLEKVKVVAEQVGEARKVSFKIKEYPRVPADID